MTINDFIKELDEAILEFDDVNEAIDFLRFEVIQTHMMLLEYDRVLEDVFSEEEHQKVLEQMGKNIFIAMVELMPESDLKDYILENMGGGHRT